MRVLYFGTYRADYSRNRILIEGLRRNGVEVLECHEPLWRGIEDRVRIASGGWMSPAFFVRVFRTYARLLRRYREIEDYDVMVLGYPGQVDVFLARILTWIKRKPLVLDVFMSIYLIAEERGLTSRHPLTGCLIRSLEGLACRLPDLLILDTEEYLAWFEKFYKVPATRFRLVPTGADDRVFRPLVLNRPENSRFLVLYYGSFIPNHGVRYIIEAAKILQDAEPDIQFELVGDGPDKPMAMSLAREYGLKNVVFHDWMDQEALVRKICEADLVLGAFGITPQSLMTVQNKIYEGLAMAKPVVTGDGPAVRRQMVHGEHILLCKRADSRALADVIGLIKFNPILRECIAKRGYKLYKTCFDLKNNGALFGNHLYKLLESWRCLKGI